MKSSSEKSLLPSLDPIIRYVTLNNEDEIVSLNNLQFVSAEEILLGNESDFPIPDTELIESRTNSRIKMR